MKTLHTLIVDDERRARKRLGELLAEHPRIEIVGEAECEESALAAVESLRPDVLFLDMELSPGNGLALLPRLSYQPVTIFVTAYDSFAVQAFSVCAFDYLLKPVLPARLAQTIHRLLSSSFSPGTAPELPATRDRIVLRDGATTSVVALSQILAIQASGAYTKIYLREAAAMTVLRSISEWERLLPLPDFIRLDRSLILHAPSIRLIMTISRDEVQVALNGLATKLTLGRTASQRLKSSVPALFGNGCSL